MAATARRRSGENHPGVHHLRSPSVLRAIVRSADLHPDDHVLELGAGPGTLTAALARTGARVTAIERDPRFVADLRRRLRDRRRVTVRHADLRTVPLPRGAKVVANLPFATSSAVAHRLLDPPGRLRPGIDLLVEHGFARRLSGPPRSPRSAWWTARYEMRLLRPVAPSAFAPPPAVGAAHLRIRPRAALDAEAERRLWALLQAVDRDPTARAGALARRLAGRGSAASLRADGVDPSTPAGRVAPHAWAAVARRDRP